MLYTPPSSLTIFICWLESSWSGRTVYVFIVRVQPAVANHLYFAHQLPQGLVIQLRTITLWWGRQQITNWTVLAFPCSQLLFVTTTEDDRGRQTSECGQSEKCLSFSTRVICWVGLGVHVPPLFHRGFFSALSISGIFPITSAATEVGWRTSTEQVYRHPVFLHLRSPTMARLGILRKHSPDATCLLYHTSAPLAPSETCKILLLGCS